MVVASSGRAMLSRFICWFGREYSQSQSRTNKSNVCSLQSAEDHQYLQSYGCGLRVVAYEIAEPVVDGTRGRGRVCTMSRYLMMRRRCTQRCVVVYLEHA